ncbi:MAG: hypothetical protein EP326_15930 [Deltaproteobacteria bacterium]|nr:MAG: hypothetical protein EP326_15930 [Deltaproteobacteria bacterium]TNF26671.1 MAG: hypothetical protein EP319_13235 [Deltaproteobacteria bacterium]
MRKLIILNLLVVLSSCSSIRMKYEATIVDDLFHTAQFEYYKSYDVGNLDTWCMVTGIFLGGACWGYLAMPSEELSKSTAADAHKKMAQIFGENNFKHNNVQVSGYGWSELPEDYSFPSGEPLVNNSPYIYKREATSAKKKADNNGIKEN